MFSNVPVVIRSRTVIHDPIARIAAISEVFRRRCSRQADCDDIKAMTLDRDDQEIRCPIQ